MKNYLGYTLIKINGENQLDDYYKIYNSINDVFNESKNYLKKNLTLVYVSCFANENETKENNDIFIIAEASNISIIDNVNFGSLIYEYNKHKNPLLFDFILNSKELEEKHLLNLLDNNKFTEIEYIKILSNKITTSDILEIVYKKSEKSDELIDVIIKSKFLTDFVALEILKTIDNIEKEIILIENHNTAKLALDFYINKYLTGNSIYSMNNESDPRNKSERLHYALLANPNLSQNSLYYFILNILRKNDFIKLDFTLKALDAVNISSDMISRILNHHNEVSYDDTHKNAIYLKALKLDKLRKDSYFMIIMKSKYTLEIFKEIINHNFFDDEAMNYVISNITKDNPLYEEMICTLLDNPKISLNQIIHIIKYKKSTNIFLKIITDILPKKEFEEYFGEVELHQISNGIINLNEFSKIIGIENLPIVLLRKIADTTNDWHILLDISKRNNVDLDLLKSILSKTDDYDVIAAIADNSISDKKILEDAVEKSSNPSIFLSVLNNSKLDIDLFIKIFNKVENIFEFVYIISNSCVSLEICKEFFKLNIFEKDQNINTFIKSLGIKITELVNTEKLQSQDSELPSIDLEEEIKQYLIQFSENDNLEIRKYIEGAIAEIENTKNALNLAKRNRR